MFGEILGFKRFTSSLEVIRRSQQTVFGITDMPKPQTFCRRSVGQVSYIGLACAIEARKAGASVLVLEKMRAYGGNSTITEVVWNFWTPKCPKNPYSFKVTQSVTCSKEPKKRCNRLTVSKNCRIL